MIRILHSVSNMDRAGIETMLMNFYRHMDREQVQFDFLQNKPDPGDYDEEIRELGGRLFVSPGFLSYPKYEAYMTELLKEHPEYKIIHTHNGSLMLFALKAAQKNNVPIRIAHAHATAIPPGWKNEFKKLLKPRIKYAANHYWGCSNAAGEFYFTPKYWNAGHELIHNAINTDNFTFNEAARAKLRREYGLGDKFILGHVGRLTKVKNQAKIVEVFAALHREDANTHLVLVGTGELENDLKAQAAALGIADAVTFTGVQSNVNEWYSVFDAFIMCSFNEGLPVVAVEAQAADLPCVLCNTITTEVKVIDSVKFLGLNDSADTWARAVREFAPKQRGSRKAEFEAAGYDIAAEAKRMQQLYLDLYNSIQS